MVFKKTTIKDQGPLLELKEKPYDLKLTLRNEEEDKNVTNLDEVKVK